MGNVTNLTHPLFERYGKDLATVLAQVPVYKYWPVHGADDAGLDAASISATARRP